MAGTAHDLDPDGFIPSDFDERSTVDPSAGGDAVHDWFGSDVPSGQRGGVDEDEAARLAARPHHEQTVGTQDRSLRKFTGCQFVAHVSEAIKFDKNGDMVITLKVPYQFKHLALPLTDAFGIPVSVDVQIWQPFHEAAKS